MTVSLKPLVHTTVLDETQFKAAFFFENVPQAKPALASGLTKAFAPGNDFLLNFDLSVCMFKFPSIATKK